MFTNLAIMIKYSFSLFLFSIILAPLSLWFEGTIFETLMLKSGISFLILISCLIGNALMYLVSCGVRRTYPEWSVFISGGVRAGFYVLIIMTAYNYELNMVEIYGEYLPVDMWYVTAIRHILINMMFVHELEMINGSYKNAFEKNLPIIGMLVNIRNGIQGKILSKFNIKEDCPVHEDEENLS